MARAAAEEPLPGGMIGLFDAAPGAPWSELTGPGGFLEGDFLKVGSAADFDPHGADSHQPSQVSTTSSSPSSGLISVPQGGLAAAHYQHTHSATVSFAASDHRPPYIQAIIAKLPAAGCP